MGDGCAEEDWDDEEEEELEEDDDSPFSLSLLLADDLDCCLEL